MLNPILLRIYSRLGEFEISQWQMPRYIPTLISENVALYCENFYVGTEELRDIDNFGLTLPNLVRMDFVHANSRKKELEKLNTILFNMCRRRNK